MIFPCTARTGGGIQLPDDNRFQILYRFPFRSRSKSFSIWLSTPAFAFIRRYASTTCNLLTRNGFCLFTHSLLLPTVGLWCRLPDAAPSLHVHYTHFLTTTNSSAPVSHNDTLILIISVICISLLTLRRPVPVVPAKSLIQRHACYTPDTIYAAFGIHP